MEFLDEVIALNEANFTSGLPVRTSSMFGSISGVTPTARSHDRIPFISWEGAEELITKASEHNIKFRYTLNTSCIGSIQQFKTEWETSLKAAVEKLHSIGISEWTVTSPLLCIELSKMYPKDFIEVSTIDELSTPTELLRWMNIGANGACLSTSVNRDRKLLESIASTVNANPDFKISLLANEACLYRCPFRRECYNLSSHDSFRGPRYFDNYPFKYCNQSRMEDPAEWVRSRLIAPQWMDYYRELFDIENFKIAFRTHPIDVALPILKLYMKKSHKGNLLDLWPTIRHLGNTEEPADSTFISLEELDNDEFIENILGISKGISNLDCKYEACGASCSFCNVEYEACKKPIRKVNS